MEYFYTPPHLISSSELTIDGDEFAHLTHVMRKKSGDTIRVVNGAGTAYDATIIEVSKRFARCEIMGTHARLNEPSVDVTLGVAILKNASKFDFLVEKVTELGVNTIVPLITERTIPRHAKTERWQKLALAAMKQSGRCVLPRVQPPALFMDFIAFPFPAAMKIIPHEKETHTLASVIGQDRASAFVICIGPEGGFSEQEIILAQEKEFRPASLGPTRLRTETAAIVASALILAFPQPHPMGS